MLYAIVAVLVILADQMIKLYVSAEGIRPSHLIPGILNLGVYNEAGEPVAPFYANPGGAFGVLGGQVPTYWFIIIAGVFTLLVVIALSTKFIKGFLARWSIVLVTAGGISNCIDRVINSLPEGEGHVVDMFQFDFWKTFPIFNLADVFISVFCVVFIFAILFGRAPKDEGYEDEFVEDEDELEEEEEEERVSRKSRKSRKSRRNEEEDEVEEEEEERPVKPARGRKARQSKYDEEYEQYKAAQAAERAREEAARAAQQPQPAAVVDNPSYDEADPFAEWERANAEKKAEQPAPVEEKPTLIVSRKAQRSDLDADPQYAAAEPVERPVTPAPQPQPVEPETPAPKPARRRPAPAPAPAEEDTSFSLDDILAEFK